MTLSDAELIQRILKQDSEAFAVLFDRYIGQVTDHLTHMLRDVGAADDVAQEVFLRVWNRADQWSGTHWAVQLEWEIREIIAIGRICFFSKLHIFYKQKWRCQTASRAGLYRRRRG